ncbi:MAG: hypothetical protein JO100_13265 [Pseudonocardia sp.]|nr:hypothetical protein [Pseudonocardia sp.]
MATLPPGDLEGRVRLLEQAVDQLREEMIVSRTDAAAARELAAGADRDVSEVRAELRAHTRVLNAVRENQLDLQSEVRDLQSEVRGLQAEVRDLQSEVRRGFTEMKIGMAQIVRLLGGSPNGTDPA